MAPPLLTAGGPARSTPAILDLSRSYVARRAEGPGSTGAEAGAAERTGWNTTTPP